MRKNKIATIQGKLGLEGWLPIAKQWKRKGCGRIVGDRKVVFVTTDHFDARLVSVLVSWFDRDLNCNKVCGWLGGITCSGSFVQLRDPRKIVSERVGFLRIDLMLALFMVDGSEI